MVPSCTVMIRLLLLAASGEWVTMRMVCPVVRLIFCSRLMISAPALLSKFPVGCVKLVQYGSPRSVSFSANGCKSVKAPEVRRFRGCFMLRRSVVSAGSRKLGRICLRLLYPDFRSCRIYNSTFSFWLRSAPLLLPAPPFLPCRF